MTNELIAALEAAEGPSEPFVVSADVSARFWSMVDKCGPDDCWLWVGPTQPPKPTAISAYGYFDLDNGRRLSAHRVSYILQNGHLLDDLVIDHLCRNSSCVMPDHLDAVTTVENFMRCMSPPAKNARKTHCKRGHELSGNNLWKHNGKRHCRECRRQQLKDVRKRQKQAMEVAACQS